jgi:penicillin amidase
MLRRFGPPVLGLVLAAALLAGLGTRVGSLPPLGMLLDPADGLYRTARQAAYPERAELAIDGLEAPVTVVRDARGVPHIFAENHADATAALGYVVAQDRLFQLDFIPRVASGRLAAAFGPSSVQTDRFLRATGMDWGAKNNLRRIRKEGGKEWKLLNAYTRGVNAYLGQLEMPEELPLEFRLLGYRPTRWSPLQSLRVLQYMTFDLTYRTDAARYATLRRRLGPRAYRRLYPRWATGLFSPMVPPEESRKGAAGREEREASASSNSARKPRQANGPPPTVRGLRSAKSLFAQARASLNTRDDDRNKLRGRPMHGFTSGKGSNNWAVAGRRSATGRPLLANDMHLSLSLPAVFYEAHLVTPQANAYGVAIPGTPTVVAGYNDDVAWGLTNTSADQIDHYALGLTDGGQAYRFEGEVRPLRTTVDTIEVNGGDPVRDTLYYSHHGPVLMEQGAGDEFGAVALRWVAHEPSRTLQALYRMTRAEDAGELRDALRYWDTPMQNVIYADSSEIGIVAAGLLPVRKGGGGAGLLDGTTSRNDWTGRVPFDELPQARAPQRGYLFSNNQQPTGSTYGHYLNHDWRTGYRSMRIDSLLRGKKRHSRADLKRYQADVRVMQHAVLAPLLDTLGNGGALSPRADRLRRRLLGWDGKASRGSRRVVGFDAFYRALRSLTWDEVTFSGEVPTPEDAVLHQLLAERPQSRWLDVQATPDRREDATGLLRVALEAAADTLASRYGDRPRPRWGARHKVLFRHLTQNEALSALSRGPVSYPGYDATLSPARGDTATHSAAWRMVVDFSTDPPTGQGIYPGGQSGTPFSPLYDLHLKSYVNFAYYDLKKPRCPGALADGALARLELRPK